MQMQMHTPAALLPHYLLLLASSFLLLPFAAPSDIALLLAKVKPALQGPAATPNAQLATWNASTPLCLWRGLRWSTPAGHPLPCHTAAARANLSLADDATLLLVSIRLPAAALAGRLPPDLGAFSALASLDLAANSLSGPIPLELGNAPALSGLDLAGNALSGVLPPSIWNLCDRLAVLRLHGNALTGAIPTPPGRNTTCDRLRLLDLGANRFSGDFPSFLTAFRGLQSLDLGGNRLSGSIPDSLAGMRGLQTLNLSYNNFSGQLPPGFADSAFTAESFLGNNPSLCGPLLRQQCVSPSGHSSRSVAGMVIGLMASAVVVASMSIGWALGRWRRNRVRRAAAKGVETDEGGEGKPVVFQGREDLTLEEARNATGQVVEKASYCTVKAKLVDGGGNIDPNAAAPAGGDWRAQLQPEARNRIVNKIMETLKKHLPVSLPEGLNELQKIAVRFEEKIYTAATDQSDYLRKISLKMLSMETKTQQPPGNAQVIPNQNPSGPASVDSTAQTGRAGAGDWQEDIYQMVKSLKDQYFAELSELYNKISVKLQHVDSMVPPQTPSDQYEKMKCFKMMLERTLQFLQINKNNIQPALREKVPLFERQIISILNSQRRKPVQTQGQQQFQQYAGQALSSNISQQQQPSQGLPQHDSHTNQMPQASLPNMSTGLQSSSAVGIQHVPAPPATNFGVPTTQQHVANAPLAGSNLEAAQGSNLNSLQHGSMSGALQQGSIG